MSRLTLPILFLVAGGSLNGAAAETGITEATLACRSDVLRLCAEDVPNRPAIIACMQQTAPRAVECPLRCRVR